jgi:colanic acid/amylovoran biosynthesis glycosyltransferase
MKYQENIKNKKKIVFKISEFPHVSETFIIAQIITAIQLNYQVVILVNSVLDFKQSLHEDILLKYKIKDLLVVEDIKIPKNKFIRFFKIFLLFISNISHLKSILNFYKFQKEKSYSWIFHWNFYQQFNNLHTIFHIQYGNNKFPIDVLKAKCNFKAKVITTFHGHDAFFPMHGFIPNNGYYDLLFDSANLITANTKYLADKVVQLGCPLEKLQLVPVGVDTTYFTPLHKVQNTNSILKLINVGRLDPVKGHKYLIEIVNEIIKKGISVQLDIIGEGLERMNLEAVIEKYNLSETVKLVGKKTQSEIKEMYLQSDLYVFAAVPLPDGRRETQGLATLEAQACGLPVLAYDSGGVKYTIDAGKTGFIFDEFEIEKVVAKLLYLNENRTVIQEMSNNCFKFVDENFSQHVITKKWSSLYSNL